MFLSIPGWKQTWPNKAALWSPVRQAMGTAAPNRSGSVSPNTLLEGRTSGNMARGIPIWESRSASHSWEWMLKSMVRDALERSVAWTLPPVRR